MTRADWWASFLFFFSFFLSFFLAFGACCVQIGPGGVRYGAGRPTSTQRRTISSWPGPRPTSRGFTRSRGCGSSRLSGTRLRDQSPSSTTTSFRQETASSYVRIFKKYLFRPDPLPPPLPPSPPLPLPPSLPLPPPPYLTCRHPAAAEHPEARFRRQIYPGQRSAPPCLVW